MKKIILICLIALFFIVSCSKAEPKLYEGSKWEAMIPEDWVVDEEGSASYDLQERTRFKDGKGNVVAEIQVEKTEDPNNFRDFVITEGYTLEDYKERKIEKGIEIGDDYGIQYIDELEGEEANGVRMRNEGSATDTYFLFVGKERPKELDNILTTFKSKFENIDHKDPPSGNEGKRYEPLGVSSKKAGEINFAAEYLALSEPLVTYSVFDFDMTTSSDYFYVLSKKKVYIYNAKESMKLEKEIDLPAKYELIDSTTDGRVWVSGRRDNVQIIEGLEITGNYEIKENLLHIHPSGEWGIDGYITMEDMEKVNFDKDGKMQSEKFAFTDEAGNFVQKHASEIYFLEDKIAVYGNLSENDVQAVCLYDYDGKWIQTLVGAEELTIGTITGLVETQKYYIASDMTYNKCHIWDKEGNNQEALELMDVIQGHQFGEFQIKKSIDGNYYLILTDKREDSSSYEILLFKMTIEE